MIKNKICLLFFFLICFSTYSQNEFPYKISWKKDGIWLVTGLSLNALGFYLIKEKSPISVKEFNALSKEDVPAFDRWIAGNYSKQADRISDYPFYTSFSIPLLMMLTEEQKSHSGTIAVLFVETMATTGALYTFSAGTINRSRPLTYNEEISSAERRSAKSQRSFFGGHTAASASAFFFAAKVYTDLHPSSSIKPLVWTVAAVAPAWVAYLRQKAGKHFLSDNLVGYAIGAASGILIPELHKKENDNLIVYPVIGDIYKGLGLNYKF